MEEDWTEVWDADLASGDPLGLPGYAARLGAQPEESVRTGRTATHVRIEGRFDVLGGSMGVVHGERVVRAFDRATALGLPVVCVTRSGGARMQEGMVSLVQLGRTVAAARRHADAGLLSVAVLRSPTTGGVLASYASSCALRVAEAGAVIGFAGPRIVAESTGASVAGRSHTAETALAAGLVDAVVPAAGIDRWVAAALGTVAAPLAPRLRSVEQPPPSDATGAWAEVVAARRLDRPTGVDVAAALCRSWTDLAAPDPTVRTGLATVDDRRIVVIASDRHRGDGRATPQGFRQAQRAVALAGRLGLPVVTLVDTPGADPGPDSENGGVAAEIAATFAALEAVPVPTVGVCVGEGGSGGALALAWTDVLLIQEHAVFSVIGPEGAAVILERDAAQAPAVAGQLGLTSADLLALGVVDAVVPDDVAGVVDAVRAALRTVVIGGRQRRPDTLSAAALR